MPGSKGPFIPKAIAIEKNVARAQLYFAIHLGLVEIIRIQCGLYNGDYDWDITEDLVLMVEQLLIAAAAKYTHGTQGRSEINAALSAYRKKTGQANKKALNGLKNLISLQRHIMKINDGRGDFNAFDITYNKACKMVEFEGVTGSDMTHWGAAFTMIGKGSPEGMGNTRAAITIWTFTGSMSSFMGMTPANQAKAIDPTMATNWQERENFSIYTVNPLDDVSFHKLRKSKKQATKADRAKRAATTAIMVATIVAIIESIMSMLAQGWVERSIDHEKNKAFNRRIFRKAQVLLFVVLMLTCPARACEILEMTMDDILENVHGAMSFMVCLRGLMGEGTMPRALVYTLRRWYGKALELLSEEFYQDVWPFYATAISLPDVMEFCFTIMFRFEPELMLYPENNPSLRLFIGTGNGKAFGKGHLSTGTMDQQLMSDLPPGIIRGKGITGYSCRVGNAVIYKGMKFLGFHKLAACIAEIFGHITGSQQADLYAGTRGRCKTCTKCVDTDGPCPAGCNPKRIRKNSKAYHQASVAQKVAEALDADMSE